MVIVAFPPGEKYAVNYTTLDQYDYGQILRIQGLKLPKTVEVHFSTQETGGTSITRVGVTKDGVTDVLIPDSVLENGDTAQNYSIFAFVYVTDATSGKTEYRARLEVKARPKPEVPGGGDNPDIFHEAVLEVRKSAEKAEEAQRQAEGWAHGREDLPERAEDNAMYYAGKASEDAKKTAQDRAEVERLTESNTQMQGEVAEDLEEVKKLSSQAQTSATNAALSEQKSKEAATRAETAQAGAETAEDNAELAAQKTGQDKTAVEQAKKLVQQMGQEVLGNKNAVDKTVQDFDLTAQQALTDVNNAGQTQTERVQSAGTTAVENIKTAQDTATQAVETAKAEAVKTVQTEGTTQTGNVTAEGEKQVQAVQTAAQEIIADREQIAKNKTDIADLRQNKADAIVETASGTLLNVKDSSGAFFEDFSMSGKTTQDGTPTPDAPVEIANAGQDGTIEIKVTGKNLIPFPYPDIKEIGKTVNYKGVDYTVLQDGGVHLKGTPQDVFGLNICTIPFKDYGTIKVSDLIFYDSNNNKTFFWYPRYVGKAIDMVVYPQVECGTVATSYEQYRELQTITLSLDRPLTKWDRLEKREGVWGIVRQSAQEELTQYNFDTYILPSGSYPTGVYCYATKKSNAVLENQSSFCTHFKNSNYVYLATNAKIGLYSDHDKVQYKYFISDKPTVEEFKAWLTQQKEAGTPVELVYKTAEEIWEPLPEETQKALNELHTNYPTTIVANSEDTEMKLSYVADTKNYHLGREEILQKQILEIQNALISQKISGGGIIQVKDSVKLPIQNLRVFGKSEQNGVPAPDAPVQIVNVGEKGNIKINITGKNLVQGRMYYVNYSNRTLFVSDINREARLPYAPERETQGIGYVIPCRASKTYTISVKNPNENATVAIAEYANINMAAKHANALGRSQPRPDNVSYTAKSDGIIVCGIAGVWTNGTTTIHKCTESELLQVEEGAMATEYEVPAEHQSLALFTPSGLLGLKIDMNGNYTDETGQQWITDEIDLARGKYVQRIARRMFDGNEQLGDNLGAKTSLWLRADNIRPEIGLCNYGKKVKVNTIEQEELSFSVSSSGIYLYTTKTAVEFKNLLKQKYDSGKPVEVLYALKTPIETDLPPETISVFKKLHTNYLTTIVSNNADAGMELTYTVDTQSYIDSKIAEVSKALL